MNLRNPNQPIKPKSKRICVLVDPETWEDFKRLCAERYGIKASAQINIFLANFIAEEKRKMKEEIQ